MAMNFEPTLVRSLVGRLTDHPGFQQFYFEFLMAENETSRSEIGRKFMETIENSPKEEREGLRAEWSRCFLKLPKMVKDLHGRVEGSLAVA